MNLLRSGEYQSAHELVATASRQIEADALTPPRSGFADVARAVAVLMMLQGHTLDAVLANEFRTGPVFATWSFFRGLASCIFLILSGFVFSLATHRHWTDYRRSTATLVRRFRRFGFFLMLGYALHFPMAKIAQLQGMSEERWRSFLIIDVLQCIAVMLATLQVLVWAARTPGRYTVAAALGCAAIVAMTPVMWRTDWERLLPWSIAAYLSAETGSPFPLFPWGAYILLGAVLGSLYVRANVQHRAHEYPRVLVIVGIGMCAVGLVAGRVPLQPFGETEFWYTSPNLFLVRAGLVLLILGGLAYLSRCVTRPMAGVQALARESLTVYAVHVCLVYGSVWNEGLRQQVGPTLPLLPAAAFATVMCAAMMLLASGWHSCKRHQPGIAQWVRFGAGGVLLGRLL